ncbi:MAG TPA: FIST N-terminal domain-containing protein [Saprospiraceae bacterium]|nr:FIST N-terminal domain-containing protein [Saprospiraceae bacterium]
MLVKQFKIKQEEDCDAIESMQANWVLCFGSKHLLENTKLTESILKKFDGAEVAFCSTAGEICCKSGVCESSIVITAISFDQTQLVSKMVNISNFDNSYAAGQALASGFDRNKLQHLFVLSDGSHVNGSELVKSISEYYDNGVLITGGLAGDDTRFESTLIGLNGAPSKGNIVAFGLYGDHIIVTHGSKGGWDSFGLTKTITKSSANELFEIDGKNALDLYKEHLGRFSEGLPGTALLFPLMVRLSESGDAVVRTILSINYEKNSMVFAGDVPEGSKVNFMMANFDRLIDAAGSAAKSSLATIADESPDLAILISCVGRRLVLGGRVDEEVEAVLEVLGPDVPITGFYSYGEISPLKDSMNCQLHNQTMTITCLKEIP